MAHLLVPRTGHHYLSPRLVVSRLLSEFPYVASNEEDGRRYVSNLIRRLQSLGEKGRMQVHSDYLDRLSRAQRDAVYVYFEGWDSGAACLSTVVIPEEPIFFHYSPGPHERAAHALLLKCARTLDYQILEK